MVMETKFDGLLIESLLVIAPMNVAKKAVSVLLTASASAAEPSADSECGRARARPWRSLVLVGAKCALRCSRRV